MAVRDRRRLDDYLDRPYRVALSRREAGEAAEWTAVVEELPGCEARGGTPEEAARQVRPAMEEWIGDALDQGRPVPEPRAASTHSGRLLVRMPTSLHADLARLADRENVSLNALIIGILGGAVAWRSAPGQTPGPPVGAGGGLEAPVAPDAPSRASAGGEGAGGALSRALVWNLVLVGMVAAVAVALLVVALVG